MATKTLIERLQALGKLMQKSLQGLTSSSNLDLTWTKKLDKFVWGDPSFPPPNNSAPGAFATYALTVSGKADQQLQLKTEVIVVTHTPREVADNAAYNAVRKFVESNGINFAGGAIPASQLPEAVKKSLQKMVGTDFEDPLQTLANYIDTTVLDAVTATPI